MIAGRARKSMVRWINGLLEMGRGWRSP